MHSSNIDDKVLFKSDGMPTYHLANIVDDHLMHITHVISEEYIAQRTVRVLATKTFGWERPAFAHLPLITEARWQRQSSASATATALASRSSPSIGGPRQR